MQNFIQEAQEVEKAQNPTKQPKLVNFIQQAQKVEEAQSPTKQLKLVNYLTTILDNT